MVAEDLDKKPSLIISEKYKKKNISGAVVINALSCMSAQNDSNHYWYFPKTVNFTYQFENTFHALDRLHAWESVNLYAVGVLLNNKLTYYCRQKLTVCKQTTKAKVITFTVTLCFHSTFCQKSETVICCGSDWR